MSDQGIVPYSEEQKGGEEKEEEEEEEEEVVEEEEVGEYGQDYGEGVGTLGQSLIHEYLGEAAEGKGYFELGEYGEAARYYYFVPATEEPPEWEKKSSSATTVESVESGLEVEETEEERQLRREREALIEEVRQKMMDRMVIKRRNSYLHKKLVEHFKKRRMENVFKEDPKGLDLEKKYLKRLYDFQDFKQFQEKEVEELTNNLSRLEGEANGVQMDLDSKLADFVAKAKEVSLNLVLAKSGKKLGEREVDRRLRRLVKKIAEKGAKKLEYIEIKNLIEEKERELKAMEHVAAGLFVGDYEQMKIDNQNLTDKIEEKEDELTKMRLKTQEIMQTLSQVREKEYAIGGDIELMSEKVYAVEKKFAETRKRLTEARKKRDMLRDELNRQKMSSGLLTRDALLRDFESSISEAKSLTKNLESLKKMMLEKAKKEEELSKAAAGSDAIQNVDTFKIVPKNKRVRSFGANEPNSPLKNVFHDRLHPSANFTLVSDFSQLQLARNLGYAQT